MGISNQYKLLCLLKIGIFSHIIPIYSIIHENLSENTTQLSLDDKKTHQKNKYGAAGAIRTHEILRE